MLFFGAMFSDMAPRKDLMVVLGGGRGAVHRGLETRHQRESRSLAILVNPIGSFGPYAMALDLVSS